MAFGTEENRISLLRIINENAVSEFKETKQLKYS